MNFSQFKYAVQDQLALMESIADKMFVTDISGDELWECYLNSFPKGTNPIYRERTEHDCSTCRSFVKRVGNMVAVHNGQMMSVWDIKIEGYYQVVADALSELVKSKPIRTVFASSERTAGVDKNHEEIDGQIITWEHFFWKIPRRFVVSSIGEVQGRASTDCAVFRRGMKEITIDACETVLELISQGSLYRGAEHKEAIQGFLALKRQYDKAKNKDLFCWKTCPRGGGIRNTVIGTLLLDISEGKELDAAVSSFEQKVAPQNYKRPKPLITKTMIAQAQKKVSELGLLDALERRHARIDDLTINNVLFADRSAMREMNVFDALAGECESKPQDFSRVESVGIDKFIFDILPTARKLEMLLAPEQTGNLFTLTAPVNPDTGQLFKWDNNFAWVYNGEVADSIKDRVKKAGGQVSGYLRISLSWFNTDDLDLHVWEPRERHIYFDRRSSPTTGGKLDVDMNVRNLVRDAVENIIYPDKNRLVDGKYEVKVHNYTKRESCDVGFEIEIECNGQVTRLFYDKPVGNKEYIHAADLIVRKGTVSIVPKIQEGAKKVKVWGISTHEFHPVKLVMLSPNHWDDNETGNKHYMFALEGCKNPDPVRGFFNEFLRPDLLQHKRVFEVLASKMKAPYDDNQISGLGFSSTKRAEFICKISGAVSRIIKVEV